MLTALDHDRRIAQAEVSWIVSKRAAAMRSRDADWLAARYVPGAHVVGPTPPVTRVADPHRDAVRLWEWFELLQGRVRWSVRIERVRMNGDRATVHCVEQVSLRAWMRPRVRLTLATTVALVKVADVWLIEWEVAVTT